MEGTTTVAQAFDSGPRRERAEGVVLRCSKPGETNDASKLADAMRGGRMSSDGGRDRVGDCAAVDRRDSGERGATGGGNNNGFGLGGEPVIALLGEIIIGDGVTC